MVYCMDDFSECFCLERIVMDGDIGKELRLATIHKEQKMRLFRLRPLGFHLEWRHLLASSTKYSVYERQTVLLNCD